MAVGDAAVVHELEEDGEDFLGGFFDLVEEEDGEGTAAEGFGQLAAGVVSDVAGRGADHAAEGVALLVFGHVEADHGFGVVEEEFGKGFGEEGFTLWVLVVSSPRKETRDFF